MNHELKNIVVATLHKENETLKKHYKDLYDSIKITRSKTIEQTTSLLANNAELKATDQEKDSDSKGWKPTGRNLSNRLVLEWIPTGKLFEPLHKQGESEPHNGSNVDIPNIHGSKQTPGLSASTSSMCRRNKVLDLSEVPYVMSKRKKSQSMADEKADISETIVKVDSQMMIQNKMSCSNPVQALDPYLSNDVKQNFKPQGTTMSIEFISS
ncbi:hypothetical protein Tco_0228743 [Tanacetum coccineum]